ncbi:actin cytoplasmic type 5 [Schistosoma japonicum]|nr:actin cytoplasmic type 5 [Schistosoma japonicum]
MQTYYIVMVLVVFFVALEASGTCEIPAKYIKTLFSIENGKETTTQILKSQLIQNLENLWGSCYMIVSENTNSDAVEDIVVLYKNMTKDCFFCYDFIYRSPNVLQYRRSQCQRPELGSNESTICRSLVASELETGFVRSREDYSDFNCKSIIEGVFAFDYRIVGSTGLCTSPFSLIKACQRQGSPLRDNSIIEQTFGYCPNFQDQSILEDPNIVFGKANIWRCYGRWTDKSGNIWAAIAYDTNQLRFRYRCLTTRIDQQNPQDMYYWGTLSKNPKVDINATHIYMKRKQANYLYDHIYFVCRQQQESRYLMTVITLGK